MTITKFDAACYGISRKPTEVLIDRGFPRLESCF
jgi:hypothetical protein